ncbi:MAG: DUF4347 domain-containing protein, partial [Pirellulaceae bacterium]|nr:DUF4347 domain-containing protein [Pirellulaceae bacterium]
MVATFTHRQRTRSSRPRRRAIEHSVKRRMFLEKLEDRRLLAGLDESVIRGQWAIVSGQSAMVSGLLSTDNGQLTTAQLTTAYGQVTADQAQLRRELVIVDAATPNYHQLLQDAIQNPDGTRQIEVLLIESEVDGVVALGQILAQYRDLDAVHVISHGAPGQVHLGNAVLSAANLAKYADSIRGWADAMAPEADILFYGCDLAGDAAGQWLAEQIAALTGTDVAASTDATGHADLGGNWDLEYAIGLVETQTVVTSAGQASWQELLNTPTVNGLFYGDGDFQDYTLFNTSIGGSGLYINFDANTNTLYAALVVSRTVNDNVFGNREYTTNAGWNPAHPANRLVDSEFAEFTLTVGSTSWTWRQGYGDQPGTKNNTQPTWFSSHLAGAGAGTPPPGYVSSSSFVANLNTYATNPSPGWNMNVNGSSINNWKSPFEASAPDVVIGLEGYPATGPITYSPTYQWEWAMVYEWSVDLSAFGPQPLYVLSGASHHSPAKTGGEDDTFPPPPNGGVLLDFGDLPGPYPTTSAANGARHQLVPNGAFLGSVAPDNELNGQPHPEALGDDNNGADDEDGVQLLTPLIPGQTAVLRITAGTAGYFSAFLDFDGNGTLDPVTLVSASGPTSLTSGVIGDLALAQGVYDLTIQVPANASGEMPARFRFTNAAGQGGNSPTGLASTGEVEDYIFRGSIGDRIWLDTNGNGVQDPGEAGIAGVTVTLTLPDNSTLTTVTDADGYYLFDNLLPGTYAVTVDAGAGSPVDNLANTGDPDGGGDSISIVTLAAGEQNLLQDFGYAYTDIAVTKSFMLFQDLDGSNNISAGDSVRFMIMVTNVSQVDATNVTIRDYVPVGYDLGSVVTVPTGTANLVDRTITWSPLSLNAGASTILYYNIPIVQIPGFDPTDTDDIAKYENFATLVDSTPQDNNPANDSDFTRPLIADLELTKTVSNSTPNVGDVVTFQVSVFNRGPDTAYGVRIEDRIPSGFSNVNIVSASVGSATVVGSTIHWNSNVTIFPGATVTLVFNAQVNSASGAPGEYTNVAEVTRMASNIFDPDSTPRNNVLAEDDQDTAAVVPWARLGNYAWVDLNGNGIQEAGEPGLNGVTVHLLDGGGNVIATTITADDGGGNPGYYSFANLAPGTYSVRFVEPTGYAFTAQNSDSQGVNGPSNSDADPTTGETSQVTLISGQSNLNVDVGLYQPVSIGDFVWEDLDGDGIQDAGEPGVQGVQVTLYDVHGVPVATTTTDPNGFYSFGDLPPGTYSAQFIAPSGYIFSPKNADGQGVHGPFNSDADPMTGTTPQVTLLSGQSNLNVDAGLMPQVAAIVLVKTGTFGAGANGVADVGELISYTFTVTNTGNVTLDNVVVNDPLPGLSTITFAGGDTNSNNALDVGEVWTYTATYAVTQADIDAGSVTNLATVTADDPNDDPVTDDDDHDEPLPQNPGISIEKATNGQDADAATGPLVPVGSTVTWTYVVTNTGNVPLANVTVTDNVAGVTPVYVSGDANNDNILDLNETWTYQATGTAVAGQYANLGTATGTPPVGDPVSDSDPSHYFGSGPA